MHAMAHSCPARVLRSTVASVYACYYQQEAETTKENEDIGVAMVSASTDHGCCTELCNGS